MSNPAPYADLLSHQKAAALLGSTAGLLGWDQETKMPPGGLDHRADQLAQLAELLHARATDPRVGDWLDACEDNTELTADAAVNLRHWRRDYDRATRLPADLVVETSRVTSRAKAAWAEARQHNDYARFAPWLAKVVDLCRRRADCYGYPADGEPWDALAEGYERGMTAATVEAVFQPLRERLVALIDRLRDAPRRPDDAFNRVKLPVDRQEAFVREMAAAVGFDFDRGRLDVSAHPFCSGSHPGDVRLTTRFHDDNLIDALGSTLHETGHGLYEQGLPPQHSGTPRGEAVGLSIHESQSRLWENQVGRSRAFWKWATPKLHRHFGDALANYDADAAYAAANRVAPSLIRVEADEATYNLHIMVRFNLERRLLRGDLSADDLPEAWNHAYQEALGVSASGGDDANGCLQDIHWSMGALGYFPTYTLGNLYAAQFFEAAARDLGDLDAAFAVGDFAPLLGWLREHVHAPGRTYDSAELCERVTGRPLSAEPLMRHLESKLLPLHGL
ncbi:MAG: carboxypeptidase M32 [Planctomycetota bacterium]